MAGDTVAHAVGAGLRAQRRAAPSPTARWYPARASARARTVRRGRAASRGRVRTARIASNTLERLPPRSRSRPGRPRRARGRWRRAPCSRRCDTPRPMLVDRAPIVDEHRAMTALVVSEHELVGLLRRGKSSSRRDVGEGVGLVGPDVHELRRPATRGAAVARHVGVVLAAQRRLHRTSHDEKSPRKVTPPGSTPIGSRYRRSRMAASR